MAAQQISGAPGSRTTVSPLGTIIATQVAGIICVQGICRRGTPGKQDTVISWTDFVRKYGSFHPQDDFPLMCKQALDNGSKLRVTPAYHYTDIQDITTVDGDASTGSLANTAVQAVAASASFTVATWTGLTSTMVVAAPSIANPHNSAQLCSYNGTAGQTQPQAATAIAAAITAANLGYTASAAGAIVTILGSVVLGSAMNGYALTVTPTNGTVTNVSATFTGGVYVGGGYIQASIATWTGGGSAFTVTVPNLLTGSGTLQIANYVGQGGDTIYSAAVSVAGLVNAGTNTNGGYYAVVLPNATIQVRKPDSTGAAGNGNMGAFTITAGTMSGAILKFQGASTAYAALTSTWTASGPGVGYDGTKITITPSTNGVADNVDISILLNESDLAQPINGLNRVLTDPQLVSLNKQMQGVNLTGLVANTLPLGTVTLTGGTQDITAITDDDFIGSAISKTGYYAFDSVTDSQRIWNLNRPTNAVHLALAQYCERRTDMRARGFLPTGLTIQGISDFREGTGAYTYQPIDSWYIDEFFAELEITDPNNVNVPDYIINGGGFQAANRSKADQVGPWISDSGADFGKITGPNGMRLNLGSAGNKPQYDLVYELGVNAIINDDALKIVSFGNRTCLLDKTSLLSKSNIADMVVYISRQVNAIAKAMNFKPNDVQMFNLLYTKVKPFIIDVLVAGRAIEGDTTRTGGEGKWWYWFGDQFAKDLNDLKLNNHDEVDAGKYRVRFAFKPIAANEYIVIDIAPATTAAILNVAQLQNLNQ